MSTHNVPETFSIPVGPLHVALEEPMYFKIDVQGETVSHIDINAGHAHRGIEYLTTKRTMYQNVVLTERKTPPFDLGQFRSQGIVPEELSVIGVKAAVAHRRAYDKIAAHMFWVDTPGPCSSNLKSLPYEHLQRVR